MFPSNLPNSSIGYTLFPIPLTKITILGTNQVDYHHYQEVVEDNK